ncbi:MAG: T9SS type A sorting domain-containing protein [Melioribacteraceae bacterium]|nr:T9SS type A sorting domain-containing protein [Melioribacteraceae bacterium]
MKIRKKYLAKIIVLLLTSSLLFANVVDKNGKNTQTLDKTQTVSDKKQPDAYYLFINKLALPLNSRGVMADVKVGENPTSGRIDGKGFLYSGGFYMSGVNDRGIMWSNGQATASRVTDYLPGNASIVDSVQISDKTYEGLFIVKSSDETFGESWREWSKAVEAGAYFYDGDGDGIYTVSKSPGDSVTATDDVPDILGDETIWCVYNDALESSFRQFPNVKPQGIEVRQTVWAYSTAGDLGNIIFVRYSLLNTGLVSEVHDSVYFGVWADPDLGNYIDDLVGSDTSLNAGYVYNDGPDDDFGVDPPAFLIDFFQGPWDESEDPTDFALNTKGPIMGIDTIWGYKNLDMTSFMHFLQTGNTLQDPNNEYQARYYLRGLTETGASIDPCNWELGAVFQEDCASIDPTFMYSGDPVSLTGWINTAANDQRQLSNTGPFKLKKDVPVDVVVAYVVGRGNSAVASVKETKKIDRAAQFVFQNNFNVPSAPPAVKPIVKAGDTSIELIWETKPQMDYNQKGVGYDMHFEWYEVTMYQSYATSPMNAGMINAKVIARYDVKNDINAMIYENPVNNERTIIYDHGGTQLDSATYFDADKGRISLKIMQDPFTSGPLLKNKPYFFSITTTAVNMDEIEKLDALGTYIIPATATLGTIANVPTIIDDDKGNRGILTGDVQNEPYYAGVLADHVSGIAEADVSYSVQDKEKTTTNIYEIGFYKDSLKIPYELFYYVKDLNTGVKLVDSTKNFFFDGTDFENNAFDPIAYYRDQINNLVDGVTVTVPWVKPGVGSTEFDGSMWYTEDLEDTLTGGFYVGRDIAKPVNWLPISSKVSNSISVSDMKRVELRFGSTSKAFRYVRDPNRFVWNGIRTSDLDSGFVDVPFQAWVKTDTEEYQLAVGFTESANSKDTLGNEVGMPDAKYFPGNDITLSEEYILIFDAPYSDNINDNLIYSNNLQIGKADLTNGTRRIDASFNDSLKAIGKSPWFNSMYVCGFETDMPRNSFVPTGTFILNPGVFLTDKDKYHYTIQKDMTEDDGQAQWDKVNVFPNPLFGLNEGVSYLPGGRYDEPVVTFNNLPNDVTIKLYSLSGVLLRTLSKSDATSILRWDLENESGLRVASGMYIALVSNPKYGDKVLKLAIIMPQKQIQRY